MSMFYPQSAITRLTLAVMVCAFANAAHGQIVFEGKTPGTAGDTSGEIGEYTASGATINANLITGLANPISMTVSGGDIFVTEETANGVGKIAEYTTSGAPVNKSLIPGLAYPHVVAVDGGDIFVLDEYDGYVGEYTMSGATVNASLITGLGSQDVYSMAVSGGDIYLGFKSQTDLANGMISEYTTGGAVVNASLIGNISAPVGLAVSGTDLFVDDLGSGNISEYTTDGETVSNPLFSDGYGYGLAVSGTDIFVEQPTTSAAVGVYSTSGTLVNSIAMSFTPNFIAVDAVPEPFTITELMCGIAIFGIAEVTRRKRRGNQASAR
jgi:hypothetical protein